ncbi:MAG: VWA domain-containing protein [Lachnospiraceae bacterium]
MTALAEMASSEDYFAKPQTLTKLNNVVSTTHSGGSSEISAEISAKIKAYFGVPIAPAITEDLSEKLDIPIGEELKLSVKATVEAGTISSYQWYKGDSAIEGATSKTFTVPKAEVEDSGNYYVKITSSTNATVSSKICSVTVAGADAPFLTTDLTDSLSVLQNQEAKFTVEASAVYSDGFTYQWYKRVDGVDTLIEGAQANIYTISSAQASDEGEYFVRVNNKFGSTVNYTDSMLCTLDVITSPYAPIITAQPEDVKVDGEESSFTLFVEATGQGGELSYQWYKDNEKIEGATEASYTKEHLDPQRDSGSYYVEVTNTVEGEGAFAVKSSSATVEFEDYYDVLFLIDTSKSMQFDCENENHSYLSSSVKADNGLERYGDYLHYIVSKDQEGKVVIDSSAIGLPVEACNDRLHQAIAAAGDIIDAVYAKGSYNRVAVSGFNSVLTNASFEFVDSAQDAKLEIENLPLKYAGVTNFTSVINSAAARLSEEGVARSGAQQLVIIISDGVPSSNDAGSVLTGDENYNGAAAAYALKEKGIDVLTLGVGNTTDGMKVYQSNGTLSGSLATLLARESALRALGDYD